LLECVEEVPLERIYVSGLPGYHPTAEQVTAANDEVRRFLKECPKARGQIYLNPALGSKAMEEFERCVDMGFCMVKLWMATRAGDPQNFTVYEAAIARQMPVLLHCFEYPFDHAPHQSNGLDFAEAARRYPECTFIMAHMSGDYVSGVEAAREFPNAFVDLCGSYGELGMVEYAVERMGADRVLFGSDMPGSDVYHNLGKVTGASISQEERAMILHDNAARILP
jgi:predicted TIM-barrel fold metal-dependent hydrolase